MDTRIRRFMAGERAVDIWPSRFPPRHVRESSEGIRKLARRLGVRARLASRLMANPTVFSDVARALLYGKTVKARRMAITALQETEDVGMEIISRKFRFLWRANPKVASRSLVAALLNADPDAEIVHHASLFEIYARYPETRGYYSFAFVRHPFDRALSFHTQLHRAHERYEGNILSRRERFIGDKFARFYGLAETRDFDTYCEWLNTPYGSDAFSNRHFRSQHLIVRTGQDRLPDFVGRFENLHADLNRIASDVGMPKPVLPMLNTMAGWQATPEAVQAARSKMAAQLTERNKVLLRKRYAEDFDLGGYSRSDPPQMF